ncbi:MAG: NAD(P)/FAD-dependent oxidoreductase [Desulfobacteraceae bacterium]|nr:NAD(P)/FAD-dependent oxidoreductase [Desulfobacteraceae bacterium]
MSMPARQRMVVIGNGGAAIHAIMAARHSGFCGEIHQISDSHGPAFNPMLAPYYLKGMLSWENCFPFGGDFYHRHDVTCHFGSPVKHLDANDKTIFIKEGRRLYYDKCLVATGAQAVIPQIEGLSDSPYAFSLRSPQSSIAMSKVMGRTGKILVLGASLVGVKVAEIMSKRGAKVILMDVASQLFPNGAHPKTAELLKTYLENHGIEIRFGCSIQRLENNRENVCCFIDDTIMEESDCVAVCTGVKPNCDFIDKNQVKIDQAILVDNHMQSNVFGLYAAGDVSQGTNTLTMQKEWLGTWANACYQGRTAGLNMAEIPVEYPGMVPQNITPIFDWVYTQIGDVNRQGEKVRVEETGNPCHEKGLKVLTYENDTLIGANLINGCEEEIGAVKKAVNLRRPYEPGGGAPPYFY